MKTAYIVGGYRSAVGKAPRGMFKTMRADDLSADVIRHLLKDFPQLDHNRIDDVIVFNSLEKEQIQQILELSLLELLSRIKQIGFDIKLDQASKNYLAEKGFDSDFGARPLNRAIQKYLEDPLAEEILKSDINEGDLIHVKYDKKLDKLVFKKEKGKTTTKDK